jgi:FkbM family methyltransferase
MESDDLPPRVVPGSQGFVFATTGKNYTTLARRAARTLRAVMPRCNIDLYTDRALDDDVFDQIHRLDHGWFRPKMQAIRESRFERTIVMDADLVVLTDISEVFRVLDRCDIAGVEGTNRAAHMTPSSLDVPRCVPVINSGFLAVRASQRLYAFAQAWEDNVRSKDAALDQPALREMLYYGDLKFLPLGGEYNTIWLNLLDIWPKARGAPRVLHVRELHMRPAGEPEMPISLVEALGKRRAAHVKKLLAADRSLGGDPSIKVRVPINDMRRLHKEIKPEPIGSGRGLSGKLRSILGLVGSKMAPSGHASEQNQGDVQDRGEQRKRGKRGNRERRGNRGGSSPYWSAVLALAGVRSPLRVCIVGANDGKFGDPLYDLIHTQLSRATDVLLFEPQPYLVPYLSENYEFHPSHQIINAAIGPDPELVLHAVRPEAWDRLSPGYAKGWPTYRAPTGITSTQRELVLKWVSKHAPQESDPEAMLTELRVPCSGLVDALEQLGWSTEIDVLQVDAEGFDDEVIYACDLDRTRPAIIYFEDSHLTEERRVQLREHLETDYRLIKVRRDILAIRRDQGPRAEDR